MVITSKVTTNKWDSTVKKNCFTLVYEYIIKKSTAQRDKVTCRMGTDSNTSAGGSACLRKEDIFGGGGTQFPSRERFPRDAPRFTSKRRNQLNNCNNNCKSNRQNINMLGEGGGCCCLCVHHLLLLFLSLAGLLLPLEVTLSFFLFFFKFLPLLFFLASQFL